MNGSIEIHATLKKAGGRPARDPGDRPIFEIVLRTEVNADTASVMAQLGKELTVSLVPVPETQPTLPWDEAANGRTAEVREAVSV